MSWKEREPYPDFVPNLIRTTATLGALRLGIVYVDGNPVASEFAIVWNGYAIMMKTAYDLRYSKESVGSVAIMYTLRHLLDEDRVSTIDFGPDDDPYKRIWVSQRRERWGLTAFNVRTARGLASLTQQLALDAGATGKGWLKPLLRRASRTPKAGHRK